MRTTRFASAPKQEEKVQWRLDAKLFLENCLLEAGDVDEKKKLPKKLERLASFYLLHACEWQLQGMGLPGYAAYLPVFGPELPIETRPLLVENMDSASTNVCKTYYLLNQKLARMLPIWDCFHKRWNMTLNAYKAVGVWPSIKLQSITFEINRGPFKGFAFFMQQLEAMQAFLELASETDPMFEHFFEGICRDRGLDPAEADAAEVLSDLREAQWLHRLGPRTAPSRWFSWHAAQEYYELHNTERLAGMCYLGVQQGWFSKGSSTKGLMQTLTVADQEEKDDEPKSTMAAAAERERQARDKCSNGLHLAAAILANPDVQFDCKMARFVSEAQCKWHSEWSHKLKSTGAGLELASSLASGENAVAIIKATAACLGDVAGLARCGLQADFSGGQRGRLTLESPEVRSEDLMMKKMFGTAWQLIYEETEFMLMWRSAYPYRLACLLTVDGERLQFELNDMKDTLAAWREAGTKNAPFWKKARKTSMAWTVTTECFELFEEEGWVFTPRARRQVQRLFEHNMSTLVVERAFQKIRDHERDNSNAMQSAVSLWRHPAREEVLQKIHDFPEVDASSIPHNGLEQKMLPASFFRPLLKRSSCDFKDLPGMGTPSWHSKKAADIPYDGCFTDLTKWLFKHGKMEQGPRSWKSSLATPGDVLKKKGQNEKPRFTLCSMGCMVYFWPARSTKIGKTTFWELGEGTALSVVAEPILSLDDWEVLACDVASPAATFVLNGHRLLDSLPSMPLAAKAGPPVGLLKHLASNAFKGMNKSMLVRLDREEVHCLTGQSAIGDILLALVMKVLGIDAEKAAVVLRKRCLFKDITERTEALKSEEAQAVLDLADKKECQTLLQAQDNFEEEAANIMNTVRDALQSKKKEPPAKKSRKNPKSWPTKDGAITEAEVAPLLPPGAHLYRDRYNKRWTMFFYEASLSRGWGKYGENEALRQCFRFAWHMHRNLTGDQALVEGLD